MWIDKLRSEVDLHIMVRSKKGIFDFLFLWGSWVSFSSLVLWYAFGYNGLT